MFVTLPDGTRYSFNSFEELRFPLNLYYGKDDAFTAFIDRLRGAWPQFNTYFQNWVYEQEAYNNARAKDDMNSYYESMADAGLTPDATREKGVDNTIAQENTQADRSFQTEMRDTSLLSSAQQLEALGLSSSNVVNVGGASSGVSSAAATQNMHSAAQTKQQLQIAKYQQKMAMARSIIGMVGSMASSGIYGSAIGAAKHSAQVVAGATAHSALKAVSAVNHSKMPKYSEKDLAGLGYTSPDNGPTGLQL